jgi:hypothetical protein
MLCNKAPLHAINGFLLLAIKLMCTFAGVDVATFNKSYNTEVMKALSKITDVPTSNISFILRAVESSAPSTQPQPAAGGNRKLLQQEASLGVFQPSPQSETAASPDTFTTSSSPLPSIDPSSPSPSTTLSTPSPDAPAASTSGASVPTGVLASYTLSGDDATAVTRSLKQSASSGAMTGLFQEMGVAESGPGAAAAAAAIGVEPAGLALPTMSISGAGPDAAPEPVDVNPVALTADTPPPKQSSTQLSAAVTSNNGTRSSSSSSNSESSSSSSSGMFGWGLPTWAVITIIAGGSALVALTICGMCCCCCIAKRKANQEKEYEKYCQRRRTRQQQQVVASASQANKDREDAVLLNKTNADVDVVLHTP